MLLNRVHKRLIISILGSVLVSVANIEAGALEYNGPKVTFDQVYENPGDNDLKLNYARQQAAAGDLLSAAGALEGMLYSQPDWDSARLFYAIVLYELDDRESAMREFNLLNGRPLSAEQRELVTSYQNGLSEPDSKDLKISGVLEAGFRTDDNAGNALVDSIPEIANASDSSAFANGALQFAVPLAQTGGLALNLEARGQTLRHSKFSRSDYDVLGASMGFSGDMSSVFWTADFQFDNVYLDGEKYLTQTGPTLSVGTLLSDKTRFTMSAAGYYQDFSDISFSLGERFRSGHKYTLSAEIFTRVDKDFNYGASIGYETKSATQKTLGYDGLQVAGKVFKGFKNGLYATGQARYRNLDYDGTNVFGPTATARNDDQIVGRLGVGTSLNKIAGSLGIDPVPALESTFMEAGVNYTNNNSNISIYEYENLGAQLKFIWNF